MVESVNSSYMYLRCLHLDVGIHIKGTSVVNHRELRYASWFYIEYPASLLYYCGNVKLAN